MKNLWKRIVTYSDKLWYNINYSPRTTSILDILIVTGYCILLLSLIGVVVGGVLFIFLWPLAVAWAINYLFGTAIPITFTTWVAVWLIVWALRTVIR